MQINRLFEIIYMLLDKTSLTAKELAEHFEVSTRTIYRDVEILSGAGIPIYMSKGKGGGIHLMQDYILNKAVITDKEKGEILSSLHAINEVSLEETNTALSKLGALFGDNKSDWVEIDFGYWSDGEKEVALFQNLKNAILQRKVITFSYASAKGEESTRRVEPVKLIFKGMSWYLYAYCYIRQEFRFFKLKRIHDMIVTEESYQIRGNLEVPKSTDNNKPSRQIPMKLHFCKDVAYLVYDEYENYVQLEDGSLLVEGCFDINPGFIHHILAYGSSCEVIEPEELRLQVKEELVRILHKYQEDK